MSSKPVKSSNSRKNMQLMARLKILGRVAYAFIAAEMTGLDRSLACSVRSIAVCDTPKSHATCKGVLNCMGLVVGCILTRTFSKL